MVEEDYHAWNRRTYPETSRPYRTGKGVSQFEAEVLPQNKAMLAVFLRSGLPINRFKRRASST